MFKIALPILPVASSKSAERFYSEKLGFKAIYAYRPDPKLEDPCWLGMIRDGAHIVLSSFQSDGAPGSRNVQFYVESVERLRQELASKGLSVGNDDVFDQDWGNLEFNLVDPDGNRLNIAQDKAG